MSDPRYAVNEETGAVLKNSGQGWEKVRSARNDQGQILINEGAGWTEFRGQAKPPAPKMSRMDSAELMAEHGKTLGLSDERAGLKGIPDDVEGMIGIQRPVDRTRAQSIYDYADEGSNRQKVADWVRGGEHRSPKNIIEFGTNLIGAAIENPAQALEDYTPISSIKGASQNVSDTNSALHRGDLAEAGKSSLAALTDIGYAGLDLAGAKGGSQLLKGGTRELKDIPLSAYAPPPLAPPKPKAPTLDEIQTARDLAYKSVDEMGVSYTPEGFVDLLGGMERRLVDEGMDPMLHPDTSRMMTKLQDRVGESPTLSQLDKFRQVVRRDVAAPTSKPGEQRLGNMMIDEIDQFMTNTPKTALNAGEFGAASKQMEDARKLHSQAKKSELIQEALEQAQRGADSTGSGGNMENRYRQAFNSILNSPKKRAGFSGDEIQLMKQFVRGTMGQNILRQFGKLSPQGNGLMAMMGIGGTASNPFFAGVPIAGYLAKNMAERGAKKKANAIDERVRLNALPSMKSTNDPK